MRRSGRCSKTNETKQRGHGRRGAVPCSEGFGHMTKQEHLLTCLAEECAEVQQAVAKALRFGLTDGYPNTDRTNAGDIARELADLVAVAEMLEESGAVPRSHTLWDIEQKKAKVQTFLEYAKLKETLCPNNG